MILSISQLEEDNSFSKILPKNWIITDFDENENMIEIEDKTDGARFWSPARGLFKENFKIGLTIFISDKGYVYTACIRQYRAIYLHKRCYIQALISINYDSKEKFDRTKHL